MKARWTWLVRLAALGAAFALGGLLVALSGVVPVKASAGHWAITEWLLQLGKRRSIATHTLGTELPPLDAPWLVPKGAAHYDTACRPCHGSPDQPQPRIAAAMLPPPPYLPRLIPDREPEALFYIVKHGLKFTGMPAWPSQQRDDEVHAMVAFLLAFPALDAAAYRRLVAGDVPLDLRVDAPRALGAAIAGDAGALIASCERCHGPGGRGRGTAAFPKLAGQQRAYLRRALAAYAQDTRHSGIMGPVAAGLTADDRELLAGYFSGAAVGGAAAPLTRALDPRAIDRGRAIAETGIPSRDVPPCEDCHGPDPRARDRNPAYPNLAGQFAAYLELQLELFARRQRGGSAYAHIMERIAPRLTAAQRRDVAAYYASLAPTTPP